MRNSSLGAGPSDCSRPGVPAIKRAILKGKVGDFSSAQVLCILLWQFSAFAFLLQVSAAFLCTLLACQESARKAMDELLTSHLVALLLAALLLFGNELLVQHLLVTQCVAIKRLEAAFSFSFPFFLLYILIIISYYDGSVLRVVLYLRSAPKWKLLFWLDGALAVPQDEERAASRREVLLFILLRVLQKPLATADEHVWELYTSGCPSLFDGERQEQDADLVPLLPHCGLQGTHLQHQVLVLSQAVLRCLGSTTL